MAGNPALLGAMMSVLAAWGGLSIVLVGLGLLCRRAFGPPVDTAAARFADFWVGWAVLVAMLQLWHLRFPIDGRALAVAALLGAGGWLWNIRDLRSLVAERVARPSWGFWFAVLLVAAFLANQAIGPPQNYDSGKYHMGCVRWAASYPIVPGWGNLRRQFSLNSSYFLYVAMLDVGSWQRRSQHLANGLLLLALFAQVLFGARALLTTRGRTEPIHVFWLMLLAPVLGEALGRNVSSPSPDLPVSALGVVIASQMLASMSHPRGNRRQHAYAFLCVAVLAAVGVTVKLSFIAFGAVAVVVAFVVWRATDDQRSWGGRTTLVAASAAALILGCWMVRGVVISGYVAYPIGVGAAPVEWRLPASVLEDSRANIRAFARHPVVVGLEERRRLISGWSWIEPWARLLIGRPREFVMPWLAALVAWGVGLYCRRRLPQQSRPAGVPRWLFFVVPGVAIVFWFLTAPDPRFAFASFAILAPGTFAVTFERYPALRRTILGLGATLSSGFALILLIRWFSWLPAGTDGGFHPPPVADLRSFVTRSGLELYVPREGPLCWDGPLTCTASPQAGLRLRRANALQSGFIVDEAE